METKSDAIREFNMRNISIITARSGSKGIKDKNIKLLNGKPLIAYTIEAAIDSGLFDTVMVSTDSEKYAEISCKYGAEVPFLRSSQNSGDTSNSWDVVKEVLKQYEKMGKVFDTVCLLQPTSPLRTSDNIVMAYNEYIDKDANAITGVCECEHPAEYMMVLGEDRSLVDYRKNEPGIPRQQLPTYYRENGAIYIREIAYQFGDVDLLEDKEFAYVMSIKNSVDIDSIDDFEYAEFLISRMENAK